MRIKKSKKGLFACLAMVLAFTSTVMSVNAEEVEPIGGERSGVVIDATTFPDAGFRELVKQRYDLNDDGILSQDEIDKVTYMFVDTTYGDPTIYSVEGVKVFDKLETLNIGICYDMTSLDVSGMMNLTYVEYASQNLKTLDFRGCYNLVSAHHSIYSETVYISAGMTKFVGCHLDENHTGNIVIDLDGYYVNQPNGSKTVDLNTVISPELIKVLAKEDNSQFDKNTGILTIPAGEGKTVVTAGKDSYQEKTHWTFYTEINAVNDCVVTFDTKGGSVIESSLVANGSAVTKPTTPTKEGYTFDGWYIDEEYTQVYDFSLSVTTDFTLYAKWTEVEKEEIVDEGEVLGEVISEETTDVVNTNDTTAKGMLSIALLISAGVIVLYRNKKSRV